MGMPGFDIDLTVSRSTSAPVANKASTMVVCPYSHAIHREDAPLSCGEAGTADPPHALSTNHIPPPNNHCARARSDGVSPAANPCTPWCAPFVGLGSRPGLAASGPPPCDRRGRPHAGRSTPRSDTQRRGARRTKVDGATRCSLQPPDKHMHTNLSLVHICTEVQQGRHCVHVPALGGHVQGACASLLTKEVGGGVNKGKGQAGSQPKVTGKVQELTVTNLFVPFCAHKPDFAQGQRSKCKCK